MEMKLSITTIALFLLLSGAVQSAVIDINKFGGAPNADITQALTSAWKEACESPTGGTVVVPAGTYKMTAVDLKGPCKAPIEVQVEGTIQAPPEVDALQGAEIWVRFGNVDFLTVSGKGVFDGQGAATWKQNDCSHNRNCKKGGRNFGFVNLKNSIIRGITSKDSKHFHCNVMGCTNVTFDGFSVSAPDTSMNTDGIHISKSVDVKVLNANIGTGDDCVSMGDGVKQITVQNVKCGPGHGISVGSLGRYPGEEPVEGIFVKNCTINGTDNGIRIKAWPGFPVSISVTDLHFEDITMTNVEKPLLIDQEYCPYGECSKQISKVFFKNIRGTSTAEEGVVLRCSPGVPCDGVELNNVDLTFNGAEVAAVCSNVKPTVVGKAPACGAAAAAGPGAAAAASGPGAAKAPAAPGAAAASGPTAPKAPA